MLRARRASISKTAGGTSSVPAGAIARPGGGMAARSASEAAGDHRGGGVDQRAARFAGHRVERVEQVAQLAEGQWPQLEVMAAEPDRFRHAILQEEGFTTRR